MIIDRRDRHLSMYINRPYQYRGGGSEMSAQHAPANCRRARAGENDVSVTMNIILCEGEEVTCMTFYRKPVFVKVALVTIPT